MAGTFNRLAKFFTRNRTGARNVTAIRGFSAAEISRTLAPWTWDGGFSNEEVKSALNTTRARSRDMFKNSPHYRRWVYLFANNVVGEGFTFKSTPHDGMPGFPNYRLDKSASKFIEWHFWNWCNTPAYCDSTGRKTVSEIDRLNARTWGRDGEYFLLIDDRAQNPYGISLRVIRPDAVDERYNVMLTNGNAVRCGVELDKQTLKPVAYYLHTTKEYQTTVGSMGPLVRVPADMIIHGFTQEDEDQTRGITLGHAVLKKLKMLDEYDTSELVAARDEANTVGTFFAPVGREGEIANLADDPAIVSALTAPSEPGMKMILPQGYDYKTDTPNHPNREVTAFKNSMLRDVASGLGVEYANFANDWAGVSFSSVRAGTLSERDMWQILQQQFIAQSKTPVFLAWLKSFLSLAVSGQFPESKFEKFAEHEFRGRRWMWVDPLKDIRSAEIAVAHGWKTDAQIASDYGTDFDDNVEEFKRKEALVKGTSLEVKKDETKTAAAAG